MHSMPPKPHKAESSNTADPPPSRQRKRAAIALFDFDSDLHREQRPGVGSDYKVEFSRD
jgi:hypothetical protein